MSFSTNTNERENLYQFASEHIKAIDARTVIDVAANEGYGTAAIARMNPQAQVTGIDINEEYLSQAIKNYSLPNLKFILGDARKINFPDNTFDAITCFHVVEHMNAEDQEVFFEEMHRILKPTGIFIAATPDLDVYRLQGVAGLQFDHIKEITQEEFLSLAKRHNFMVEHFYGQGLLKKQNAFMLRRVLNIVKKADVLKLRRFLLSKKFVDAVDTKTQPVGLDFNVLPIKPGIDKASVNVLIAKRVG
jgi:ubiquinone/menaquinone biosynthesis C-methylase UbiE